MRPTYRDAMRMYTILAVGSVAYFSSALYLFADSITGASIFPNAEVSREIGMWTDIKFVVLCLVVMGGALLGLAFALLGVYVKQSNVHTKRLKDNSDTLQDTVESIKNAFREDSEASRAMFAKQLEEQHRLTRQLLSDTNTKWAEIVAQFSHGVCPIHSEAFIAGEINKILMKNRSDGRVDG